MRHPIHWLLFYGVVLLMLGTPAHGEAKQSQITLEQQAIFHSGEAGYYCFRIPALVVSAKGVVLAFAEARKINCGDDDNIDLVVKRSLDNGKTWGPLQILQDDGTKSVNQPTPAAILILAEP